MKEKIENKEQFINDNIRFVPKNRSRKFAELDIDEQVNRIQHWKQVATMREQWLEKNKIVNKVKELFDKRQASVDETKEVMSYCEEYINNFKQKELDKLDEEIRKLQDKRKAMEEQA